MDGFEKLHNTQDEFIKKTLQEDKIVSQPLFDNFSTNMDKTKVKVKRYTYRQKNIITLLLFLLVVSVGLNIYLGVVRGTPITITNIFHPAQDYSQKPNTSVFENKDSNENGTIVDLTGTDADKNAIKIDAIILDNTVDDNTIADNTNTVDSDKKNEVTNTVEAEPEPKPEPEQNPEPEPAAPTQTFDEINITQVKGFVNQFAIGINKLHLEEPSNLESNTILLYIAQQYFSRQSTSSGSLSVNTDYASSTTNFHKFLNEFTANDYTNVGHVKSYSNYIGYISRSKAYAYGEDYSDLSKEQYVCEDVTIINKENDVYTAKANVSRTYINEKDETEKNGYEITFTFKINNNYKYQKYKLLSLSSKVVSGDIETVVNLIKR